MPEQNRLLPSPDVIRQIHTAGFHPSRPLIGSDAPPLTTKALDWLKAEMENVHGRLTLEVWDSTVDELEDKLMACDAKHGAMLLYQRILAVLTVPVENGKATVFLGSDAYARKVTWVNVRRGMCHLFPLDADPHSSSGEVAHRNAQGIWRRQAERYTHVVFGIAQQHRGNDGWG